MTEALVHLSFTERLRKLWLFSLEQRRCRKDILAMGVCSLGVGVFWVVGVLVFLCCCCCCCF